MLVSFSEQLLAGVLSNYQKEMVHLFGTIQLWINLHSMLLWVIEAAGRCVRGDEQEQCNMMWF